MDSLEMGDPYEDQILNVNGKPITFDDILAETSLYLNSNLFPIPSDPGTSVFKVTQNVFYIKHRKSLV